MKFTRIAFVAGQTPAAQDALERLRERYASVPPDQAEVIVALGGDGLMLETLHQFMERKLPIYGMNRGTVGFLMNQYNERRLMERLHAAQPVALRPLRMAATTVQGATRYAIAINEVSLLRQTRQAAKLAINIDGTTRISELVCDGALVCTAAGSTAYNLSAHGPIIPLEAQLLGLTPISAFRPRRWRGALLPSSAHVILTVIEPELRPVSVVADYTEIRDVTRVDIREAADITLTLMFDPDHSLEERILNEQFIP
jgi:NAD+ kinase